jgi:hypothetical protein
MGNAICFPSRADMSWTQPNNFKLAECNFLFLGIGNKDLPFKDLSCYFGKTNTKSLKLGSKKPCFVLAEVVNMVGRGIKENDGGGEFSYDIL